MGRSALEQAWATMLSIIPEHRFGITAGVPDGWPIALKTGFSSTQCCQFDLDSTGVVVNPAGGAYAVTILSDGWSDMASGIDGVEFVSRAIAAQLAPSANGTSVLYDRDGDGRADPVVVGNGACPLQQHW